MDVPVTPLSWQADLLSTQMHLKMTPFFYKQLQELAGKSFCFLLPFCFAATSPLCAQAQGAAGVSGWNRTWKLGFSGKDWERSCQALSACKEASFDAFHNTNLNLSISWPHSLHPILASSYLFAPNNFHSWSGKGGRAVKIKSPMAHWEGTDPRVCQFFS